MKIQAVSSTFYHADWAAKNKMAKDCQLRDTVDRADRGKTPLNSKVIRFTALQVTQGCTHTLPIIYQLFYLPLCLLDTDGVPRLLTHRSPI